jgi:hypothetical protein
MFPLEGGALLCVEISAEEGGCKTVAIQSVVKVRAPCGLWRLPRAGAAGFGRMVVETSRVKCHHRRQMSS